MSEAWRPSASSARARRSSRPRPAASLRARAASRAAAGCSPVSIALSARPASASASRASSPGRARRRGRSAEQVLCGGRKVGERLAAGRDQPSRGRRRVVRVAGRRRLRPPEQPCLLEVVGRLPGLGRGAVHREPLADEPVPARALGLREPVVRDVAHHAVAEAHDFRVVVADQQVAGDEPLDHVVHRAAVQLLEALLRRPIAVHGGVLQHGALDRLEAVDPRGDQRPQGLRHARERAPVDERPLNMVTINVRPTVTRVIGTVNDPNPALKLANVVSSIPVTQTREMESVLKVASGQTAVLGGHARHVRIAARGPAGRLARPVLRRPREQAQRHHGQVRARRVHPPVRRAQRERGGRPRRLSPLPAGPRFLQGHAQPFPVRG